MSAENAVIPNALKSAVQRVLDPFLRLGKATPHDCVAMAGRGDSDCVELRKHLRDVAKNFRDHAKVVTH